MSLIAAMPCADGVVLASDSRATMGGVDGVTLDLAPKVVVLGGFGFAITGRTRRLAADGERVEAVYDVAAEALRFWTSAECRLTGATLDAFGARLLEYGAAEVPSDDELGQGIAVLVAEALGPGVSVIGEIQLRYGPATLTRSALTRYGPVTPLGIRLGGRCDDARARLLAQQIPMLGHDGQRIVGKPRVGDVPAWGIAGFLSALLLDAAGVDRLVGGAVSTTILRPTTHVGPLGLAIATSSEVTP